MYSSVETKLAGPHLSLFLNFIRLAGKENYCQKLNEPTGQVFNDFYEIM
jgi:hypothetical protein